MKRWNWGLIFALLMTLIFWFLIISVILSLTGCVESFRDPVPVTAPHPARIEQIRVVTSTGTRCSKPIDPEVYRAFHTPDNSCFYSISMVNEKGIKSVLNAQMIGEELRWVVTPFDYGVYRVTDPYGSIAQKGTTGFVASPTRSISIREMARCWLIGNLNYRHYAQCFSNGTRRNLDPSRIEWIFVDGKWKAIKVFP